MKSITWYAYFKIGNNIHILGIEIEKIKQIEKLEARLETDVIEAIQKIIHQPKIVSLREMILLQRTMANTHQNII